VRPLLGGVRLSLAGNQDKLAVCVTDAAIAWPQQGRPTTHILKLLIEDLDGTVENELFCTKLAASMGFTVPAVAMSMVGETDFILIKRYDRHVDKIGAIHSVGALADLGRLNQNRANIADRHAVKHGGQDRATGGCAIGRTRSPGYPSPDTENNPSRHLNTGKTDSARSSMILAIR